MPALILVVADESEARSTYLSSLGQSGWDVLDATSVGVALKLVGEVRPSLMVIDGELPGGKALELVRQLRADLHYGALPILLLAGPLLARECMDAPQLGIECLLGPVGPRELVAAVRHGLRLGKDQPADGSAVLGPLSLEPVGRRISAGGRTALIGPTECRLLHFLMRHPERVFGRALMVEQVWGDQIDVAERTVDVVVRRLRAQLSLVGCQHMIQTVRGAGYRVSVESLPDGA